MPAQLNAFVKCRIYVSDDDIAFWEKNKVSPAVSIDSMRDVLRVFINGQLTGNVLYYPSYISASIYITMSVFVFFFPFVRFISSLFFLCCFILAVKFCKLSQEMFSKSINDFIINPSCPYLID